MDSTGYQPDIFGCLTANRTDLFNTLAGYTAIRVCRQAMPVQRQYRAQFRRHSR